MKCDCNYQDGTICAAVDDLTCTRREGHDGPHVACNVLSGGKHEVFDVWE